MIRKLTILVLVLGMSSSAGAALSLVPEELTLSSAGDTGTIQVVSDTDGGYGCWIELVDLTVADYDGDPTSIFPPGDPRIMIWHPPYDPHLYEIIVMSLDPANPILAGAHINVNLVGIAEGVTTLNLYAEDGTLLDSATITVLPEPECFPPAHSDYSEWVNVGKPDCWCYPRQCHGDADGLMGGGSKCGYYDVEPGDLNILISSWLEIEPACGFHYVGPSDLNILISAWLVLEPAFGPGIDSILDGICADFAHDLGGNPKTGYYRVGPTDLNILIANWLVFEPPGGPGVPQDCLDVP
ncbi:MAG: hypothetical protein ACYS32_14795 [Planctomycetota bacterium]|jgi:hypothetical protein